MRFDELKGEDSRLLSFNSEPETGNPGPMPYRLLAASGDDGRMAGHPRHETRRGEAPEDGRGWYGCVVRAGLGPGAGARGSKMCTGQQRRSMERRTSV
jgi:hypothetical protein